MSLTKLNIDNITANVHPRLRKMAYILTHPKHYTGKESLGINDREPKTRYLACLYILGAMAHVVYAPCHYSLHLPITDNIEGQSGSADLLQMLSQLGICSSRDTLLRLKTAVLSQRRRDGMHKNAATGAFSVTSTIFIVLHQVNALHLETKAKSSMARVFSTFPYATHLHLEGK